MDLLKRRLTFGDELIPALVASAPKSIRPSRKMTVTPIPGTNREVVEMEDAWENYDQPYEMFVGDGSPDSIQSALDDVARVLSKKGWQTLLDDYNPDYYRLAYFPGNFEADNRKTRVSTFELVFRCRAEWFLISGNTPENIGSGETIFNPTAYASKPLIHIEGSGNGNLTVNDTTMAFTNIGDYLNIDCDEMDVYRLPAENRNDRMTGEFPTLKSGDNIVSFTGGITSVTITPKWFII